jgi:transcriptional regulator with XRE-family HTH domain
MTNKSTDIFYGELDNDTFKLTDSTLNKVLGSRLKHRRQLMGLNQTELGKKLQISGQQIHKYEAGIDQLSAPKIYELSSILQIPISYFFDDLEADHLAESPSSDYPSQDLEEIRLQKYINIYKEFSDPKSQKLLFETIRLFASHLKLMENNTPKSRSTLKDKTSK